MNHIPPPPRLARRRFLMRSAAVGLALVHGLDHAAYTRPDGELRASADTPTEALPARAEHAAQPTWWPGFHAPSVDVLMHSTLLTPELTEIDRADDDIDDKVASIADRCAELIAQLRELSPVPGDAVDDWQKALFSQKTVPQFELPLRRGGARMTLGQVRGANALAVEAGQANTRDVLAISTSACCSKLTRCCRRRRRWPSAGCACWQTATEQPRFSNWSGNTLQLLRTRAGLCRRRYRTDTSA